MRIFLMASFSIALVACSSGGGSGGGGGGAGGGNNGGATAAGGGGSGGGAGGQAASGGGSANGGGGGATTSDTWDDYAKGFFAKYCVACHGTSDPTGRDFEQFMIVKQNAAAIRCGVAPMQESGCGASPAPKQFPIGDGPKPSDAERDRIVAWIDAGTPQ
jgi:hypothetical protein